MKKYSHLVFDVDGTMIDSLPLHMVSLKKTLRQLGLPLSGENRGYV